MFSRPSSFQDFLSRNNSIDEIYDAMAKDDLSEVVMRALDVLKRTNSLPPVTITRKSENASTLSRNMGNDAFKMGHYQRALVLYNQALLLAPKNSRELKLAYSNRSALFQKMQAWKASNIDIEKCFAMGCPTDIQAKLMKRKEEMKFLIFQEGLSKCLFTRAAVKCIDYDAMSHNSQTPCASSDVKIVTSPSPKVIASKDIKIGTVVASERAYVSYTDSANFGFSCHFCQKKALNLIPCDDCCFALFCDEKCKNECMTEYHGYECKIMDAIRDICFGPMPNLMVKACLKLRTLCKSWKELINVSYNIGIKRIESSSVQEIYDVDNIYSILSFKDDRPFMYGILYDASFVCATILHHLGIQSSSFLPKKVNEKQQALRALARIMMFLSIYQTPLHIFQAHTNIKLDQSRYGPENFGLYPFIGKLKNSCNPNLITINDNNKLVLLAIRRIKSGEELTVSHLCHIYDGTSNKHVQNVKTFLFYGTVCNCANNCINSFPNDKQGQLSEYQKKYFSQLNMSAINSKLRNIEVTQVYEKLLHALEIFKDVPNSREYREIYASFKKCVFFCETLYGDNNILDNLY